MTKIEKTRAIDKAISNMPQMLRAAFSDGTNRKHAALAVRAQQHISSNPTATPGEVAMSIVGESQATKAGATRTLLGNVIGMYRYINMYTGLEPHSHLQQDATVKRLSRILDKKTNAEAGSVNIYTVQSDEVKRIFESLEAHRSPLAPLATLYLWLWWVSSARSGDAMLLRAENVVNNKVGLSLRFCEGKVVSVMGPVTTHTIGMPSKLQALMPKNKQGYIFAPIVRTTIQELVMGCAKAVNKRIEARSFRRGSLVHMAERGATDEELLRFSHHTTIAMLRRYLGWGMTSSHNATTGATIGQSLNLI
jgi:hypothetical protein